MKVRFLLLIGFSLFCFSSIMAQNNEESLTLANLIRSGDLTSFEKAYSESGIIGIDPVSGMHPLHLAASLGKAEFVSVMVSLEKFIEAEYVSRETVPPMILAIQNGHATVVEALLERNREANGSWMSKSYLFHAWDANAPKAVENVLIRNGASVELAKKQFPRKAESEAQETLATEIHEQFVKQAGLNRFIAMEVWNIDLRIAQMLLDTRAKYADNTSVLAQEEQEIMAYRAKKAKPFLTAEQYACMRTK